LAGKNTFSIIKVPRQCSLVLLGKGRLNKASGNGEDRAMTSGGKEKLSRVLLQSIGILNFEIGRTATGEMFVLTTAFALG
jgi:hypothetical protein